jgi:flagellar basal body rod protein FlgG
MFMKKIDVVLDRTYEYDDLQKLARAMCTNKPILNFSMFKSVEGLEEEGENVWNVNAPDIDSTEPVFKGKVQFMTDYWRVSDVPVYSEVVENPTWMMIINIFNDMLQNGDNCGIFLEGLYNLKEVGDVKIIKFAIGS